MIPSTPTPPNPHAVTPAPTANPDATPPNQPGTAARSPIPVIHPRASGQSVLNLPLDLRSVHSPQASADAPGSPTQSSAVRSGASERRNTPKKSSRKRSTASVDDRASVDARSSKHRRTSTAQTSPNAAGKDGKSTPPGSPRMVKSPRAVADLRAVAGLPPRNANTASPPTSPRSSLMVDRTDTGSPRSSKQEQPAAQGRTASWVQPVFKHRPDHPANSSLTLSPRRGSMSGSSTATALSGYLAPLAQADGAPGPVPASSSSPAHASNVQPARRDDEFTFQEVDCDGIEPGSNTAPLLFDTDGTEALDESTPVTFILISAELSVARNNLRSAAIAYLYTSVLDASLATRGASGRSNQQPDEGSPQASVEQALIALQAKFIVVDFAFGLKEAVHVEDALKELRSAAASCRSLLDAAENTPTASLVSLQSCLDALESACGTGLGYLEDDKSRLAEPESTSTASTATTSGAIPARLPISLSTAELMDDLSSLMDQEIVVAAPAVPTPEKEAKQ